MMWQKVQQQINRTLNSIRMPFRVVLTRVNSDDNTQKIQANALNGETLQDNEFYQHYGFTSNPPVGTKAVVVPLGGKTSHGIIIATEHANYRLKSLEGGEVALYTDEGTSIVLKRDKIIEATCDEFIVNCKKYAVNASESSHFDTPTLETSNEFVAQNKITGNNGMTIHGGKDGNGRAVFNGDIHQETGSITTNNDVVASNVSLVKHHHDVEGESTGDPNPSN